MTWKKCLGIEEETVVSSIAFEVLEHYSKIINYKDLVSAWTLFYS